MHQSRQEALEGALADIRLQMIDARARLDTMESLEGSGDGLFDVMAGTEELSSVTGPLAQSRMDSAISAPAANRQPGQVESARARVPAVLA